MIVQLYSVYFSEEGEAFTRLEKVLKIDEMHMYQLDGDKLNSMSNRVDAAKYKAEFVSIAVNSYVAGIQMSKIRKGLYFETEILCLLAGSVWFLYCFSAHGFEVFIKSLFFILFTGLKRIWSNKECQVTSKG